MKIKVLKICCDGKIKTEWIPPSVKYIRLILNGPIDTVNMFNGVVTYIRRQPNNLDKNKHFPSITGDVLITGGQGSYLSDISDEMLSFITNLLQKNKF